MIKNLLFIGAGSFFGGIARYGLSRLIVALAGVPSIWGTWAANITGCFLIVLLCGVFERYDAVGEHWRLFLTLGFCGGFTTFSTFMHENYAHITQGRFSEMVLYATLSLAVGLLMVYAGHMLSGNRHP